MINKGLKLVVLLAMVGLLSFAVWEIRDFGEPGPDDPAPGTESDSTVYLWDNETGSRIEVERTQMDDWFLNNTQSNATATQNAVTAIVFDYRGFDTLGEATVLFAAVTGVLVAIRIALESKKNREKTRKEKARADVRMKTMSPVVRTITKFLFAPILIFGFYIIIHGHLTPGGGFQGGAIVATLMALVLVAFGKADWRKKMLSVIESSGLLAFVGTAFLGLTGGYFFYNFIAGTGFPIFGQKVWDGGVFPNYADVMTGGTVPIMNIAVGMEVIAGITLIIVTMGLFAFEGKEGE
ncbi:MAG: hydrogen gas-evolving membrane-bound hydrogenase subunit E [Thermoplasmatota archaeon]